MNENGIEQFLGSHVTVEIVALSMTFLLN